MDLNYLMKLSSLTRDDESLSFGGELWDLLKINYNNSGKIPVGKWVVGQEFDESGNVVNEGIEVDKIIIAKVRFKNQYFVDRKLVCSSKFFWFNDKDVIGFKFKNNCDFCPYRGKDREVRCSRRIVLFAWYIKDKKLIPCISFLHGDSFMPTMNYLRESSVVKIKEEGKDVNYKVPFYSYITVLDSERKKKGSVNYFVAKFTRDKFLAEDELNVVKGKLEEIENYIKQRDEMFENLNFGEQSEVNQGGVSNSVNQSNQYGQKVNKQYGRFVDNKDEGRVMNIGQGSKSNKVILEGELEDEDNIPFDDGSDDFDNFAF